MKFTDFEVLRIGKIVVLSCFSDQPPPGNKMQITIEAESQDVAEMHEKMLQRLVDCATVYEEVSDDALAGTIQLMKGKRS